MGLLDFLKGTNEKTKKDAVFGDIDKRSPDLFSSTDGGGSPIAQIFQTQADKETQLKKEMLGKVSDYAPIEVVKELYRIMYPFLNDQFWNMSELSEYDLRMLDILISKVRLEFDATEFVMPSGVVVKITPFMLSIVDCLAAARFASLCASSRTALRFMGIEGGMKTVSSFANERS